MWPWEHAIVGYLVYSLLAHAVETSPRPVEAVTVVGASLLPDVIDKPLFWSLDVVETGYALGHSVFFTLPLVVTVVVVARARDRTRTGYAFATGYLLHTPGDVLHGYTLGGTVELERLLWPLAATEPSGPSMGVVRETLFRFALYRDQVLAADFSAYMVVQFGLAACCLVLWLYDGAPGVREPLVWVTERRT